MRKREPSLSEVRKRAKNDTRCRTKAGYGSKDVFIWLDAQVEKVFQVPAKVPDVRDKTEEAAASRLHASNLELGEVTRVAQKDVKRESTVIDQSPSPEVPIDRGEAVDITVATSKSEE